VLGVAIFGQRLRDKSVIFETDNMSVVHIINSQSSSVPAIMQLMRHFALSCLHYNIVFKAIHKRGIDNMDSDLLSRSQIQGFLARNPQADSVPTNIPLLRSNILALPSKLLITLPHSKASLDPQVVQIHKRTSKFCPVKVVNQYLRSQPGEQGPFFKFSSGRPITVADVAAILHKVVTALDLNPSQFTSHSFRMGGASNAAAEGASSEQIRLLGRCSSSAYQLYVKPHLLAPL
jgi:hypothetical protein